MKGSLEKRIGNLNLRALEKIEKTVAHFQRQRTPLEHFDQINTGNVLAKRIREGSLLHSSPVVKRYLSKYKIESL